MKISKILKLIAFLSALAGVVMVFFAYRIENPQHSLAVSIVFPLGFLTIWTNITLAVYFFVTCFLSDSQIGIWLNKDYVKSALLLYIIFVGAGYHFLISMLWEPKGLHLWGSNINHYITPILMLIDWLHSKPVTKIKFKHTLLWLIYPTAYALFTLIIGSLTDSYPYPFLHAGDLGIVRVLINILGFSCGYFILGNFLAIISNYRLKLAK